MKRFNFQPIRDWFTIWVKHHASSEDARNGNSSLIEHTPIELPKALKQELFRAIQQLSPHPMVYHSIEAQIKESLLSLENHPEAPNSLVVLAEPIEALSSIVHYSLEHWIRKTDVPQNLDVDRCQIQLPLITLFDDWTHRPTNLLTNVSQLDNELQSLESVQNNQSSNFTEQRAISSIVFLPVMEWYFIRCVNGFECIERLRDFILGDRSRFWVIGCNTWAWTFLDQVCQISTYFEQTMTIPTLSSNNLKEWLSPVTEKIDWVIEPEEEDKAKQLKLDVGDNELDNWFSSREKRFFEKIASQSQGLSNVAADLWLRSLLVVEENDLDDGLNGTDLVLNHHSEHHQSSNAPHSVGSFSNPTLNSICKQYPQLKQQNVALPNLPLLNVSDRYMLYSVLLHAQITIPHLAISLGDNENDVRAHVQKLLRTGILTQQHNHIRVNPSYYFSIRADLKRNNFLVGDASYD